MSQSLKHQISSQLSRFSFSAKRMVYKEAPADRVPEAAERRRDGTTDIADFMRKEPMDAVGNVEPVTKELKKSKSENIKETQSQVINFIDSLVTKYNGSAEAKELFKKDLIASFTENGGMQNIQKYVGASILKIDKIVIDIRHDSERGDYIHLMGSNSKEVDANYGLLDIPLKSQKRKSVEVAYKSVVKETKEQISTVKEAITKGSDREKQYVETAKFKEKERTSGYYTSEALNQIISKRVKLDKDVYKKWTKLNVSDPEVFKDISNIENLTSILAEAPFKWSLGQLHKSIQDGDNRIVEFDDLIDEAGLGIMDDNKFEETYLKLAKDFRSGDLNNENLKKLEHYNKVIDQAKRILDALSPDKFHIQGLEKEVVEKGAENTAEVSKIDSFLYKVFDKKDIGQAIVGGKGKVMDLTLADGIHTTIYKDAFKTFLTGESAYVRTKAKIWQSAESAGDNFEEVALEKTLTLMNAYLQLGAINAKIVLDSEKVIPEITTTNITSGKITEEQIKAIQIGATVEWAQEAKMNSVEGMPNLDEIQGNPALQSLTRDFFWNNPGMSISDQKEFIDAVKKIDLGSIGVGVSKNETLDPKNQGGKLTVGIGYSKTFQLPKGLTLRLGVGASEDGVATGAGIGKSHELKKGRITWEIGVGNTTASPTPFVGARIGYEFDFADYRRFGASVFGGVGIDGFKAGLSLGYRVDQASKYSVEKSERFESMDFNSLIEVLKSGASIEEKVLAIETNKHCGELMKKMSVVFEDMSKAFGKPITAEMRQDLILQSFNTILEHVKTDFDSAWKPDLINSVGIVFSASPNLLKTFRDFIGGLISFSVKGKTFVIPVAEKGIIHGNERVLNQDLLEKLKAAVAQEQGVKTSQVEVTPDMLTNQGLLTRIASAEGGSMEYRATNAPEKTSEADLQKVDTFGSIQTAFKDAHINFNRQQGDDTRFTMDVKDFGDTKLSDANIILGVDPELQKYVEVIGGAGNTFQIRFKEGFKDLGRLLVSRQDIFTPMRYNGAPRTVRIMLKADLVSDSTLSAINQQTGLYKFDGYKITEKGLNADNNSLWSNEAAYKETEGTKYLKLNSGDKTPEQLQEAQDRDAALLEHRSLWGLDAPEMRGAEALDNIVKEFTKVLSSSKDSKYTELYKAIVGEKVATSNQTEQIMKGLQKYVAEKGLPELNSYELEFTKNLFSINTFTDVRDKYIDGSETPEAQQEKLNSLKATLRRRQGLFKRIADQMFAQTTEGRDPKVRREMVTFLNNRMLQKIAALTVADISNAAFEGIDRGTLGQFLGSMAGRLADRKQGRLADLDSYGAVTPGDAQNMMAYGIKEFSVSDTGVEGKVARAIIEIEYPHKENLEGKEFLDQALSVQVAINADKFFTAKEIKDLNAVKKGEGINSSNQATFNKFKKLVNVVRQLQMSSEYANDQGMLIVTMGPEYQDATIYIKPITVKDFFFEKCGNQSWGVDAGVQFFKPQETIDRPVAFGSQRVDTVQTVNGTNVSIRTFGLGGAYTQKINDKPTTQPPDKPKDNLGNGSTTETVNTVPNGQTTGNVGDPIQ